MAAIDPVEEELKLDELSLITRSARNPIRGATNGHRVSRSSDRKRFILHVGPGKTGTTLLQCALQFGSFENYIFLGKKYPPKALNKKCGPRELYKQSASKVPDRRRPPELQLAVCAASEDRTSCMEALSRILEKSKKSLVYSAEELASHRRVLNGTGIAPWMDEDFLDHLLSLLDRWSYELTIVVTYRRYAEWLRSFEHHLGKLLIPVKRWNTTRKELFPMIQDLMVAPENLGHQYMDVVLNDLQDYSNQNITILNMHDPRGPVETFVCDILGEQDCGYSVDAQANPAVPRDYDLLAIAAFRRQLVPPHVGRKEAGMKALRFHQEELNKTIVDFPLVCPSSEELLPLLRRTIDYERRFLPDFFQTRYGKQNLEREFWWDVASNRFCSVDADEVLSQDIWREFFRSL